MRVTAVAWGLAAVALVAALANWWSRWRDHRPTEVWSKPLTLLAMIGVAVALEPVDPTVRAWFVVALVLSLAGDVFLLGGDRWFVAGLASFLLGHLAYVVGFVLDETWRWSPLIAVAVGLVVPALTLGRRIVASATARDRKLQVPVSAYLAVISMMVLSAAAVGNAWAIAGAVSFLVSDTVLGWRQFVDRRPWMPVTIMVTYHLAQAGLVASLL